MGAVTLPERLKTLVDGWCDRRALAPLRHMLRGYPLVTGLSDEWHELRAALRNVRGLADGELTAAERESVEQALRDVEHTLEDNGWSLKD